MNNLGAIFRDARKRKGLTLAQVAEMAGVDESWLCRFEKGYGDDPGIGRVARVAAALELEPAHVLSLAASGLDQPVAA